MKYFPGDLRLSSNTKSWVIQFQFLNAIYWRVYILQNQILFQTVSVNYGLDIHQQQGTDQKHYV